MSRGRAAVLALGVVLAALPVLAYFPSADQIANAVAKANRASGRAVVLSLQVDLQMGEEDALVASGTLLSDPSGMARLELSSPRGNVERHLLRGAGLEATRQGERLDRPRPFLPPFFLLQAQTSGELRSRLIDLGARGGEVALGYDGPDDCFVIGGRDPVGQPALERASLWVNQESLEVVRIDLRSGARFRIGPPQKFGRLSVPAWIEIYSASTRVGRLRVRAAKKVPLAPGAFGADWLAGSARPR